MAAGDITNLNGLFKTVYADKLQNLIPDWAVLQKKIPFAPADKSTGNYYAQPVLLAHEQGVTYLGTTGAVGTLNASASMTMKEAQVYGSEMVIRGQLSYTALSRAASQGTRAFKRASSFLVEDLNNSLRKRLELSLLYGQQGLGTVSSYLSNVITLTDATWAGGLWAGMEGAAIDIYQSDLSTARTNCVSTIGGTLVKVTAVDFDNKTITITGHSGTPAAGDVIFFAGALSNDMAGVKKILTATSTIFNIDPSTYGLWKGNTVSSIGQISHTKLQRALAPAVNKGLMERVLILCSPKAWAELNSDQSALRMFDSSYEKGKGENGFESLMFHSTNGSCEILSHPFVKDGDLFVIPLDSAQRIGSSDVTFSVPGMEEQFFRLVTDKNAVELQAMCDQALFLDHPGHGVYGSGISFA